MEAEAQAILIVTTGLVALVRELWKAMLDPYDRGQVDTFVKAAGHAVVAARHHAAGISDEYMRHVLDVYGSPVRSGVKPEPIPELPRGIPITSEYVRPVKVYRRARLEGLDKLLADDRALARAESIATMDVSMASRDARMNRLVLAEDVIGYRRIVHPEVVIRDDGKPSPVCGLCLAAADRPYRKIEKQGLHDRCRCTIAPITKDQDPGSPLNNESLGKVYTQAGGTDRQALAKQRYKIEQHAELGPVLVNATYNWRGPADVKLAAPGLVAQAKKELAELEDDLASLLTREASGEDVAGPIAWDMDRMTALRELIGL